MSHVGAVGKVGIGHHALSGPWRIDGTLSELGVPGAYEYALLDKGTMTAFRRGWSATDGSYALRKIAKRTGRWVVLLIDHGESQKNAKASDQLSYTADTAID
jgi:hypothetical protein